MTGSTVFPAELRIGKEQLTIFRNAYEAYPIMLAAIRASKSTICFETYILREDETGHEFVDALCERARSGVEVNVIYDWWGSDLSPLLTSRLTAAGVRHLAFAPTIYHLFRRRFFTSWRRRDHRKSLTLDGQTAFLGGLNIGNEYLFPHLQHGWRDTHLCIVGPAAAAVETAFARTWTSSGGPPLKASSAAHASSSDPSVRIVTQDLGGKKEIRRAYVLAFSHARHSIIVTQAYFLPPRRIQRSLIKAARRGAAVALILAGKSDVPAVTLASRYLYSKFLREGVRIYEMRHRVLHAKTAVVDGEWSTVGSANLDAQSLYHNLEVNAVIKDRAFAAVLEQLALDDMRESVEIKREDWTQRWWVTRLLSWVAYRLRWWL